MTETPDVTVKMSAELVAMLGSWSRPVQVKLHKTDDGSYEMQVRALTDDQIEELYLASIDQHMQRYPLKGNS